MDSDRSQLSPIITRSAWGDAYWIDPNRAIRYDVKTARWSPSNKMNSMENQQSSSPPAFAWLFLGKVVLLFVTILFVWALYAYLHVYRLDWLGWFYAKLLPLTNALYALIENYFPGDMRYRSAAPLARISGNAHCSYFF